MNKPFRLLLKARGGITRITFRNSSTLPTTNVLPSISYSHYYNLGPAPDEVQSELLAQYYVTIEETTFMYEVILLVN